MDAADRRADRNPEGWISDCRTTGRTAQTALYNQKNQNKENEKEEASRRQEVCQNGRYVFVTFL